MDIKIINKGLFFSALVFSAVYLPLDVTNEPLTYYYEPPAQSNVQSAEEFKGYTVKEHNGKISVFENGSAEPIYTLDSPFVRDLPIKDREILTKGINARNEAELLKILEDYDG